MIYHSTHSDDYLWYPILRGKLKKTETHPNTKFLPIFNAMVGTKLFKKSCAFLKISGKIHVLFCVFADAKFFVL